MTYSKFFLIGHLLSILFLNLATGPVIKQADSTHVEMMERQITLLSERYADVLMAYDRLTLELDRNLALIAIVVGILGVLFPLLMAYISTRNNDNKIKESERKQRQMVQRIESLAMETAGNLEDYKRQNIVRELLDDADNEDDSERAIALYTRVLEFEPNNKTALMRRARQNRLSENLSQAIADYKRVIELYPQYIVAYSLLGLTYYEGKDYEEAIKQYESALAIDPCYATVIARLANVYNAKNDFPSALTYIRRAIELNPLSIIYHKRLVKILKAQNIVGNIPEIKKEEELIKKLELEDQR